MDLHSMVTLRTGRKMPVIGLGTWGLNVDTAGTIVKALKLGYTMIDTSGDYGTQPGIADGLKQSGFHRSDYYIVTKIEEDESAYESARANVAELGLEFADLILIHRPPEIGSGEELWKGLIKAKRDGITRDIGVSNYSPKQIAKLAELTGEVPVVNQIEWSPFGWSKEMKDFCSENEIIIQAYSPLVHGRKNSDETLRTVANKYNKTPEQILIRWCLQMFTVPLPKANQLRHLIENLDVFNFDIAADDMELLNRLNEDYSALGSRPVYQKHM